jgi:hypothetical protein
VLFGGVFRGTIEPPSRDLSLEQFKEQVISPYMAKHGHLSPGLGSRYMSAMGRAIAHSSPLPHKITGVPAYVKVTSPLRRFSDMIAHWQIEGAIRYEARTGKKLNSAALTANTPRPILPFSLRQIQESIVTLSPRERIISGTKNNATHYWTVQAINRAFYYGEAPLPDTFSAWIKFASVAGRASGYTTDQSIKVTVKEVPGRTCQMGDQWLVKMHSVDVYHREICVTPMELLYRDADMI